MSQFPPFPDEVNPYAAPEADLSPDAEGVEPTGEAEAIRLRYRRHETNVRSIGLLYYLGAVLFAIGCGTTILALSQLAHQMPPGHPNRAEMALPIFYLNIVGTVSGLMALLNVALGFGIRRLQGWARWIAVVQVSLTLAVVGLGMLARLATVGPEGGMLGQLITLLVSSYILNLLIAPQSKVIFSPEYREVIAQTPQLQTGASPLVKFLLLVVGAFFCLALLGGVVSALIQG